ncbi:unnamed protein product [Notodromas monacha]|uniref:Uncharacterized protein n=1 Tax=Notodromas monacha TaxID=399045 RepID=A0A7R9BR36_9CRUS|nr:unnamed protein product [Notodromas monacha]CAG0920131.1 unnamed protein product [Notodromas monacha]
MENYSRKNPYHLHPFDLCRKLSYLCMKSRKQGILQTPQRISREVEILNCRSSQYHSPTVISSRRFKSLQEEELETKEEKTVSFLAPFDKMLGVFIGILALASTCQGASLINPVPQAMDSGKPSIPGIPSAEQKPPVQAANMPQIPHQEAPRPVLPGLVMNSTQQQQQQQMPSAPRIMPVMANVTQPEANLTRVKRADPTNPCDPCFDPCATKDPCATENPCLPLCTKDPCATTDPCATPDPCATTPDPCATPDPCLPICTADPCATTACS